MKYLLAIALSCCSLPALGQAQGSELFVNTVTMDGLVPVHVDKKKGRILLTLPRPGSDGVFERFLYATSLRTGVGSASLGLDRAMTGPTLLLAFRRFGNKVAIQFENPRFRATNAPIAEQRAASESFPVSTVWMVEALTTLSDGSAVIDIADFLKQDVAGIAVRLGEGGDKGYALVKDLSTADIDNVKVFPDNIELEAVQTYASDTPGPELENIGPDARHISVTLHHSLIRLPDDGYRPRRHDPRVGGFASQAIDFAAPLGSPVVYDLVNRFRLDKLDPTAKRSAVKKPIIFYIDRSAPEPIRTALAEGVSWWSKAFDDAGYINAFQVKILPENVDPLDVRYNVVNWVNRATRGWSYGQVIADPRTGEIVKGSVLLGSLRVRQDMMIFEGLLGADQVGKGGPNDPAQLALARLRQLGAHEVGHSLGFVHNFAASTQNRASVMDYPAPRIRIVDGHLDLSDAYGSGVGKWDMFTVDWLYGEPDAGQSAMAAANKKVQEASTAGLRFISDDDAREKDTAQPFASLWDDGSDPTAELNRLMEVRRIAIDRFGLAALHPGEPLANLRRKFVPIWLLHRYEIEAVAKTIGGVDFAYSVKMDTDSAKSIEKSADAPSGLPVSSAAQRAALTALLSTLSPDTLRVPAPLLPLLSAANNGSADQQYDIEVLSTAGGPVFDPLVAADAAAQLTLTALLAPSRLARVVRQHAQDTGVLGVDDLLDQLIDTAVYRRTDDDLGRRIAFRTIATMAITMRDPACTPEVAAKIDDRLQMIAARFGKARGSATDREWARSIGRMLVTDEGIKRLVATAPSAPAVPPGMPIGEDETEWMTPLM